MTKILGMRWDASSGILTFAKQETQHGNVEATKREILRQSSSIFDIRTSDREGQYTHTDAFEGRNEILPHNIWQMWKEIRNDINVTNKT